MQRVNRAFYLLPPQVAFLPRLPVSKHAVPISTISRAWVITDSFKKSTEHCTHKAVQTERVTGSELVASLLAERPRTSYIAVVSGFWAHADSADEFVSGYFSPRSFQWVKKHDKQSHCKVSRVFIFYQDSFIEKTLPRVKDLNELIPNKWDLNRVTYAQFTFYK